MSLYPLELNVEVCPKDDKTTTKEACKDCTDFLGYIGETAVNCNALSFNYQYKEKIRKLYPRVQCKSCASIYALTLACPGEASSLDGGHKVMKAKWRLPYCIRLDSAVDVVALRRCAKYTPNKILTEEEPKDADINKPVDKGSVKDGKLSKKESAK